jgi:hypothetical protein
MLRGRHRHARWILGCIALAFFVLAFAWAGFVLFAIIASIGAVMAISKRSNTTVRLDVDFDSMWSRWVEVHGAPDGFIIRKPPAQSAKPRALPEDIHHYSFDRAVITDRPETVDLLLANNFHFENNCAVLTKKGYPEEAFGTVRAMLKQNPKLLVYVLHDATIEGCTLSHALKSERWFQEGARIVDVGLRPEHARPFRGLWQLSMDPASPASGLSASDQEWLSKYSVELSVIRPEQVIKRLFRAMSGLAELPADTTSDMVYVDSMSFGTDASASDGGGDSFG